MTYGPFVYHVGCCLPGSWADSEAAVNWRGSLLARPVYAGFRVLCTSHPCRLLSSAWPLWSPLCRSDRARANAWSASAPGSGAAGQFSWAAFTLAGHVRQHIYGEPPRAPPTRPIISDDDMIDETLNPVDIAKYVRKSEPFLHIRLLPQSLGSGTGPTRGPPPGPVTRACLGPRRPGHLVAL